ncbi:uncharacterized protein LOC111138087 [Crassostrea virginica]
MTSCWIIFLSVHLSTLIHTQNLVVLGQKCDNGHKKGHHCCTNYAFIEGTCKPCIGTFGDNCSGGPCKGDYYGFGCLSKCNCLPHQQCDRIKGCTNLTVEKETPSDGAVYSECNIAISFLSILLVISVGLNILLKCRMSSRCICLSDQAIAQEHTGQENYDNLSDTKATHLYTTMTITK